MIWFGWLEACCSWAAALAAAEYSVGEGILSGKRAATAAPPAAARLVDEGRDGQFFLPIRDPVLDVGTGVGLLAWLRSRGLVRVRDRVWDCIGGGAGRRALGVVWGSDSISESESPSFSNPHNAGGTFLSAPHSLIWAGRTGVGDHVSGFELMGSRELPRSCGLPDIPARFVGTQVFSQRVSCSRATDISTFGGQINSCGWWEEMYNSPEDTVDYWGELIRFFMRFGSRCIAFGGKGIQVFFFFVLTPIYYYTRYIISGMQPCGYGLTTATGSI